MSENGAITTIMPALPSTLETKIPSLPIFTEIQKLVKKNVSICTDEDIETAKGYRKECKDRIFFVMEDEKGPQYGKHTKAAHALHKSLVASAKLFTDPAEKAISDIDKFIGSIDQEKRRLKELADRQAKEEQEAAQKKIMDAATAKINKALASTGRIEQQIIDMQEIVNNPESSETEIELASRQIEVLRMKLDTHTEKAAQIQKTAEQAAEALPVASPEAINYTKTGGVKTYKKCEILDKLAFIKLVAEEKAPINTVEIDIGTIEKLVKIGVVFPASIVKVTENSRYGGRG